MTNPVRNWSENPFRIAGTVALATAISVLDLVRNREAVNLKLGYRASAGNLSPGLVLRGHVMDSLIAEGSRTFDLLGSAEPYKLHWAERTVPHVRLRGLPPTPLGRMRHRYSHRLRPTVGKALMRVRRRSEGAE